jgi:hypothetical protein
MRPFILLLLASFTLSIASCSDDTSGPTLDDTGVTAKVNGRALDMTSISSGYLAPRYFVSASTGIMPPNENISIDLDSVTAPGTFTIAPATTTVRASYEKRAASSANDEEYEATSGTITVTEIDAQHAKGSFSFEARLVGGTTTVTVTEGTFSTVKY